MIRIYNARILTMEEGKDVFEGEIWIEGNQISYVGTENREKAGEISWERQRKATANGLKVLNLYGSSIV